MPYTLPLEIGLRKAGWQVKIYDAEGPDKPHVSIYLHFPRFEVIYAARAIRRLARSTILRGGRLAAVIVDNW
jgi:hypothetical protein